MALHKYRMKLFNCKYPIVAVGMNKVSDVPLAIACHRAGIFPTISVFNYLTKVGELDPQLLKSELEKYIKVTGSTDVIVSMTPKEFIMPIVQEILLTLKISHVELLDTVNPEVFSIFQEAKTNFNYSGGKIIFKVLYARDRLQEFDGYIIKGSDGAGRSNPDSSLEDLFQRVRQIYPNAKIIPSGGISTSQQIKYWMDNGAEAVGIGTLFAASKESSISNKAKEQLVNANSQDLKILKDINQRALVFSETSPDGINNTPGLRIGIKTGTQGHLFAGKGVDQIKDILTVEEIVQTLIKDL